VELLINAGADVNASLKKCRNMTVLMMAADCKRDAFRKAKLLLDAGAKINTRAKCGRNAVFFAVCANNLTVVELLLKRGIDANTADKDGLTPLDVAEKHKYAAIAKLLSDYANAGSKPAKTEM
jgi:ankyrin repeat protein